MNLKVVVLSLAALTTGSAVPASAAAAPLSGPAYSHTVYSNVHITGDILPGRLAAAGLPAPCWLEPRFTGAQSYARGDPRRPYGPGVDADTYWWWFASQQPGMMYLLGHIPDARQVVNRSFQRYQGRPGWWWAPAWVDTAPGWACAQGLVDKLNLTAAFLDFQAPADAGGDAPGHTIDGPVLADLARAALALPGISLHTSPSAPATASDVNLPTWVWVTYRGPRRPRDTASVALPGGGTLSATVATSQPVLSLSVSGPGGAASVRLHERCGATGSRYTGADPAGVPACGVTFLAPSTSGPWTLTATVSWQVRWSDSTGRSGEFTAPPYPPSLVSRSVTVTVREIQAVNGG